MHQQRRVASFEAVAAEVYEPLQRYLRRRVARHEVDELLNDVLLTIWRRLDDVPEGSVLPWCYGVARRTLANHRRGDARRLRLVQRLVAVSPPAAAHPWTEAADVQLQAALDRLPERDRELIRLWAWEHLEPREIAVVLGETPNAVTVRLGRIRRRLQREMARQDPVGAGHRDHEDHPEQEP